MGVGRQPCTRLASNMNIILLFCLAFCPSIVFGLVFDPFRSLLLSLKGSIGNDTLNQDAADNETWIESFHKIISDTNNPAEVTTTAKTDNVVTIPSSTITRAASLLKEKLDRFVFVNLVPDYDFLTEREKSVLVHLVKAAALMDPIFERQVWTQNPGRGRELEDQNNALTKLQLEYMKIMRGPWDRTNEDKPFAIDRSQWVLVSSLRT